MQIKTTVDGVGPILSCEKLDYTYEDGTHALKGIDIAIPKGGRVAVIGPNGAGKSTFLLHLNGIHRPTSGKIFWNGVELSYDSKHLLMLRQNVGFVFQEPDNQLFSNNVFQDVSFGPVNLGLPRDEIISRVEDAMRKVDIVHLREKPTHLLSFGQKKRVAIAGVLAMNPEVLIFDEPTAGLDPGMSRMILELLNRLNEDGKTLIISTHDMDFVYEWAEYCFMLKKGEVAAKGKVQDVFIDEERMTENGLRFPWMLSLWNKLVANSENKGFDGKPPTTMDELSKKIYLR